MTDLAVLSALLFAVFCAALAGFHARQAGRLTLLDWSVLAQGGVYGGGWVLVILVTQAGHNPTWESWLLPSARYYVIHTASALVLLGGMLLGWLSMRSLVVVPRRRYGRGSVTGHDAHRALAVSAWLMFAVALLTQWIYGQAYGGFIGLLDYSAAIRSAIFTVDNRWSFLRPLGGLTFFSSFIFFGLVLSRKRNLTNWLGLLFSVGFSLYILYSWLGRIAFLVYGATFVLGYLYLKIRNPVLMLAASGLGGLGVLVGVYWLSYLLSLKFTEGVGVFLAKELSFPFGSFFAHLNAGTSFRWFIDLLVAPAFLLPSKLLSGAIEDVAVVNTTLILGHPKGVAGVTGGIPVDLLTLGLLQASFLGILLVGVLFGALLRILDRLLGRVQHRSVRAILETHVALKIAVLGVFYAQPALFVQGNFYLLIGATVMSLLFLTSSPWFLESNHPRVTTTTSKASNQP